MIDALSEQIISLTEAAKILPQHRGGKRPARFLRLSLDVERLTLASGLMKVRCSCTCTG